MNSRERFLKALRGDPLVRPPVWVMRQAGRYLPEYRALKAKHSFTEMVRTPDLAEEVTLQPLRRFNLDAAILFSDILIIPEALGQPYHFREMGGIGMEFPLDSVDRIHSLDTSAVRERLDYVPQALRRVRRSLKGEKAILGFGGSPWTLACYMVEGGSSESFTKVKTLFYTDRPTFERLMERLVDALVELFTMKIEAGVDALQIFDSWGAACPGAHYEAMSLRWIRAIVERLPPEFPVILFAKGMAAHAPALLSTGARALAVDWTVDLPAFHDSLPPGTVVQGNLDPVIMELTPEIVRCETRALLQSMRGRVGHILNLGHGITPRAKIENMEALVQATTEFAP
jgi:uroporphyrinogen decarboxylase